MSDTNTFQWNTGLCIHAMETGTVQINSVSARGLDHFPFQVNNSGSIVDDRV
ncbi:conserved hypothetical protein [Ricinus communis]|uniref:Uncharacterized protein n=1 Tax=Ricinus communis TaxID=3988 RepID=B9SXQ9_RICCO|nr:conserved hypothetical protein [Ricinus communis]